MATVLLLYASTHGHTAKVAERVGDVLRSEGIEVEMRTAAQAGDLHPRAYDGVLVAGSVHRGSHQHELVDWARSHHTALEMRPSALVSVSLVAADGSEEARQATRDLMDDFLEQTGWTPSSRVAVAGALQYREYDVFTRTLMRLQMSQGGHPTDISRDFVYTDWEAVERFARAFAAELAT